MDTPEKENFLETIRDLRKEAEEKLTGNRHYLAIQKLDEIAEAVEQRTLSSEELGAVSEVLRGEHGELPAAEEVVPETATTQTADLVAPAAAALAATTAASVSEDLDSDEPILEGPVADLDAGALDEENALPNWWKDGEEGANPAESELSVEPVVETVDESSLDLASMAAGSAVAGAAAAAVVDQFSPEAPEVEGIAEVSEIPEAVEPVEIAAVAEEIELVEVPEVELETVNAELPVINVEAVEPDLEMPVIEVEAAPELEENVQLVAPEMDIATGDVIEEPAVGFATDEIVVEEAHVPDIVLATPAEPDASAQIADLLSDADTQAIAAGAAAAAIGVAGITMIDEPEVEVVEHVDIEQAAPQETPEKLSFPDVPLQAEAVSEAKILTGDNIERHPTYGGNRGGILKRFANSLRGKDYI